MMISQIETGLNNLRDQILYLIKNSKVTEMEIEIHLNCEELMQIEIQLKEFGI